MRKLAFGLLDNKEADQLCTKVLCDLHVTDLIIFMK